VKNKSDRASGSNPDQGNARGPWVEMLVCVCLNSNKVFGPEDGSGKPEERAEKHYGKRCFGRVFNSGQAARFETIPGTFEAQFLDWLRQLESLNWTHCSELKEDLITILKWYANVRHCAIAHPSSENVRVNFLVDPERLLLFLRFAQELITARNSASTLSIRKAYSGGSWFISGETTCAIDIHVVSRFEAPGKGGAINMELLGLLGLAGCAILCQDAVCFRIWNSETTQYRTIIFPGDFGSGQPSLNPDEIDGISRAVGRALANGGIEHALEHAGAEVLKRTDATAPWCSPENHGNAEQLLCLSACFPTPKGEDPWPKFAEQLFKGAHQAFAARTLYGLTTFEYRERTSARIGASQTKSFALFRTPIVDIGISERLLPDLSNALLLAIAEQNAKVLESPNPGATIAIPVAQWTFAKPPEDDLCLRHDPEAALRVQMACLLPAEFRPSKRGLRTFWDLGITGDCHCALCDSLPHSDGCKARQERPGLVTHYATRTVRTKPQKQRAWITVECHCACLKRVEGFFCGRYFLPLHTG